MFLFFRLPEKHPWPLWLAAPIAFGLCGLLVAAYPLAATAFMSVVFWTLPTMPNAETVSFCVRLYLAVTTIFAVKKLREYYSELS